MENAITLDYVKVAEELNDLHSTIETSAKKTLEGVFVIGSRLVDVKESLPHGEFGKWIEDNLSFSDRTVQNYMSAFRKQETLEDAGIEQITDAYSHIKAPKVTIEATIEDVPAEELNVSVDPDKKATGQQNVYAYWDHVSRIIDLLNSSYHTLSGRRNAQTPSALGHFIGNLKEIALRLEQWTPDSLENCEVCGGKGTRTVQVDGRPESVMCDVCIKGKAGPYKESEF